MINENLPDFDDNFIELIKITAFPFADYVIESLKKTICSFLNSLGGTILIGIDEDGDNSIVRGVLLTHK